MLDGGESARPQSTLRETRRWADPFLRGPSIPYPDAQEPAVALRSASGPCDVAPRRSLVCFGGC